MKAGSGRRRLGRAAGRGGESWCRGGDRGLLIAVRHQRQATFQQAQRAAAAAPEVPVGGHEQLRVGKVAEILAERGTAWEHRLFAAALTRARRRHRASPHPVPTLLFAAPQVVEWAIAQMQVPQQIFGAVERLIETDLQKALRRPGQTGDADAILGVA